MSDMRTNRTKGMSGRGIAAIAHTFLLSVSLKALQLLLSSRPVGSEEALAMGLCDKVLPCSSSSSSSPARDEAEAFLLGLSGRLDPSVARAAKLVCSVGARTDLPLADRLAAERDVFARLWGGEAQRRALRERLKH